MHQKIRTVIPYTAFTALFLLGYPSRAQDHPWQPQPEKAAIMVVSAHPDDEGIFFGGAIPYYTQVRQLPMVHISMTSGDWGRPPEIREEELRDADWIYGLRNEPLFPRFRDWPTNTLDETWDVWADGIMDGDDIEEGREAAALYVAEQIRRYRPDVIITHDIDGEYGHNNHRATSLAVIDAWTLSADANEDISGLNPHQASKLYIHQSEANGLGTPGYSFDGWLFHDYWEDITIDFDEDGLVDRTPRQIADVGLDAHVSQGSHDASTVYRTGENYDGHHSEWWGLYASIVGPDTMADSFTIEGMLYDNWAYSDFFEHIDLSGYNPYFGEPGDINQDGIVSGDGTGQFEFDDVTAFVSGWKSTGHATLLERWRHGDLNLDGRTNLIDWHILRTNHPNGSSLDLGELLASVPEPTSLFLIGSGMLYLYCIRLGRRLASSAAREPPA